MPLPMDMGNNKGGGKNLIASSIQGVNIWIAAPGGTAWLEPHWSMHCCPARRNGQKDESYLWKWDCAPGKMLYQGCPSWCSLSLGLCHLLSALPYGNDGVFLSKQDLPNQIKQCGICNPGRCVSMHLQLQIRPREVPMTI